MVNKEKVAGPVKLWDFATSDIPLCPGCQHGVISAIVAQVMEDLDIGGRAILAVGAGCSALTFGGYDIDRVLAPHGRAPDAATGVKRVHPDAIAFTVQGDGDMLAIGGGPLLGALARGEKITIFMYNNAHYASTGGQMAPTTLTGQITPTTPSGRDPALAGYPIHAAEMLAQFKTVAYSARGAVNNAANYQAVKRYIKTAFQKQIDNIGLSYVEVISACPVQWRVTPLQALERVEEIIAEFPLGEFKNVDSLD